MKKLENLEDKPRINKQLREAWKIVYPFGTIPRKTSEMKQEVIAFLGRYELGTNPDFIEKNKEPFLLYLRELTE